MEINTIPRIRRTWEEDLDKKKYEMRDTKYEILEARYKNQEIRYQS